MVAEAVGTRCQHTAAADLVEAVRPRTVAAVMRLPTASAGEAMFLVEVEATHQLRAAAVAIAVEVEAAATTAVAVITVTKT